MGRYCDFALAVTHKHIAKEYPSGLVEWLEKIEPDLWEKIRAVERHMNTLALKDDRDGLDEAIKKYEMLWAMGARHLNRWKEHKEDIPLDDSRHGPPQPDPVIPVFRIPSSPSEMRHGENLDLGASPLRPVTPGSAMVDVVDEDEGQEIPGLKLPE